MKLKEIFATFGLDFDQAAFDKAEGSFAKLTEVAKSFGAVIVSAAMVNGLANFTHAIVESSQEISTLAARANVSTTALQQMAAALAPLGLNLEGTSKTLEELNIKIGESAQGGDIAKTFRDLNVEVRDANGQLRSGQEVFLEVTDAIAGMGSAAERTATLNKLMGEEGRRLAPALAGGTNGLRSMMGAMEGLEGITPDVIQDSQRLAQQWGILDLGVTSLKNSLARELIPPLIKLTQGVVKLTRGFGDMVKKSNAIRAVIVTVGTVLAAWGLKTAKSWALATLEFVLIAAAIAAVVLIVDDLYTLFTGGESAIGGFIDSMFGVGTTKRYLEELKDSWHEVGLAIDDAGEAASNWAVDTYDWFVRTQTSIESGAESIYDTFLGIGLWFDALTSEMSAAFSDVWDDPMKTAEMVWTWISDYIKEKVSGVSDWISDTFSLGGGSTEQTRPRAASSRPSIVSAATPTSAAPSNSVTQNTPINITITGNPSQAERERLRTMIGAELDQRNREAQVALVPNPE